MTNRVLFTLSTLLGLALFVGPLHAEDRTPLDNNYIALKLTLGVGGTGKATSDKVGWGGTTVTSSTPTKRSDDLEVSYGLAGQYMVPLHKYFAIGGLLGLTSWQSQAGSDNDASRNLALDLAFVPEVRLPLLRTVELYLAVPVGLSLDWLNEVESSTSAGGIASAHVDANTAVGFMISALLGVRVAVLSGFGVFAEVGYTHRQFSHTVTGGVEVLGAGTSAKANLDISTGELALNLGAYF